MLNSAKLHDDLWSLSLASMFNWSPNSVRPNGCGSGESDKQFSGKSQSRQSQQLVDPSSIYHHFPFATNFNFLSQSETSNSLKENIMKQAGGKSFTIDSLLGINASQVAIHQNRIRANQPPSQGDDGERHWALEKGHNNRNRENKAGSYPQTKKERHHPYTQGSGEKQIDKASKVSRRSAKSKRVRTIFTPEQLERLEAEFERQQYMVGPERLYLASSLYLTEAQVKVWFQNRRIKWRKQHLEMQQQRLAIFRSQGSQPENEEDLYDEESDEDGSTSETLPPTDSSPSTATLLTSFTGSLLQDPTTNESETNHKIHPEYPRNLSITQQLQTPSQANNNVESLSYSTHSQSNSFD